MWTWILVFLIVSYEQVGINPRLASFSAFVVIASGGLGSLIAGKLADQYGRTTISFISLLISGTCALIIGRFYGGNPKIVLGICLTWWFTIVADSAQYSASISELCKKEFTSTALRLQTSLGFLLTSVNIRIIPILVDRIGWGWAFSILAEEPAVGIWAMFMLRKSAFAVKLSNGRKYSVIKKLYGLTYIKNFVSASISIFT